MSHLDPAVNDDWQLAHSEVIITPQILNDAMSRVSVDVSPPSPDYDFDTRFDDIGMESLEIAELIVELEEILGKQLDLVDIDRFQTLGDLCRSLRAIGELQ
jgi:acyl carrier protein